MLCFVLLFFIFPKLLFIGSNGGQNDFSPVLIHVATMYACNRTRLENFEEENTPWARVKIPFEKTFITISYILLFSGQRSLIRNNTQIIFLFRYLGIKATESGVLLVTRKFIHPVHLSA